MKNPNLETIEVTTLLQPEFRRTARAISFGSAIVKRVFAAAVRLALDVAIEIS
jgi:hypothetical protein